MVRKEEQGPLVLLEDDRGRNGANRQVPEPGDGNAADLKERPDEAAGFQKKHLQASEKETTSAPPQTDLAQQPDKTSMLAEKNASEKTLQTFQNAEENYIINPGSALDNFSRISQPHSSAEDLAKANPNYKQGAEYRENCQRCVPAYELRRRGYDVQAKPAQVTANGKISPHDPFNQNMRWFTGIFSNIQWKTCRTGAERKTIEDMMLSWGDGARAEIYVAWKTGGAHVFVAEQINGKTMYSDPQSGTVDFAYAFAQAKSGSILFARIDLLQVTDTIKECIDNVR
jgi:hypothetical protein